MLKTKTSSPCHAEERFSLSFCLQCFKTLLSILLEHWILNNEHFLSHSTFLVPCSLFDIQNVSKPFYIKKEH